MPIVPSRQRDPRRARAVVANHGPVAALLLSLLWSVGCGSVPGDPADPQVPACLERANFGPRGESEYRLPFPAGQSYQVFQTYCGPVSHGKDGQMSIDFLMPLGSDVVAARDGTVREVVQVHRDFGRKFNRVYIEHEDGSSAFYAHLQQGSVRVQVGDVVRAGQSIASSGASGTSLEHLHFGVAGSWPPESPDDIPVNFRNARGVHDQRGGLERGMVYEALAE